MEIEKQRWAALQTPCGKGPGAFGWSHPLGTTAHESWDDAMELEENEFLFDVEYKDGWVAGAYLPKSCTEYASYPDAWKLYEGTYDASVISNAFTKQTGAPSKAGRVLDLDIRYDGNQLKLAVIFVPNYGPAARAWWWSGTQGYTADELSLALQGKAIKAFKQDNTPKKIVAIDRGVDGKFRFVLNQVKPGEAWWWGFGVSTDFIATVLNGDQWGSARKRLVSLKRHASGNWTFVAVPEDAGWAWYPKISFGDLTAEVKKNNHRVIDLERYGSSETEFSAVTVQNT